ncbi:MAG: hypothetical protein QOD27_2232 [Microbacteriaceae bacterium]|nr:hypothetical protein [Microbacteriaceae bacterium]MDQ1550574.1 hypothetical protein [Microbacteriaceae bacterium]MDQ1577363.1 hypothetical protein [Microbacteriaceae bacterium]
MTVRTAVGLSRLVTAALCATALVARFIWGLGSVTFTASNFFAYLTIQGNMAFVLVSILAGVLALRGRRDPRWLDTARAAVLSCTISAGVVFGFLIQQAGERGLPLDVPWSDQVLHFWLPSFAILDWIFGPGRGRAQWRAIPIVLGYTVVWGILTLLRGAVVGWYPYFFLDPAQVANAGEFVLLAGLALVLFAVVSVSVVALTRARPLLERWGVGSD